MNKVEHRRMINRHKILLAIRSEQARCGRASGYSGGIANAAGMSTVQATALLYAMQRDGIVRRRGMRQCSDDRWEIVRDGP